MVIPGIGEIVPDRFGWYRSKAIPVPLFGGQLCHILLENYVADTCKVDFHNAIDNFLAATPSVLLAASESLFRYYKDFEVLCLEEGQQPIESIDDIWNHVQFGNEPIVRRRVHGDRGVYMSIECECTWEPEHGLELVLKNGQMVTKLGQYDGHLSNADAFDNPAFEQVIYVKHADM